MDNVVQVEIVYGFKYLSDGLCGVLLRELALLANAIEELSARRKFGDDVVLVLSSILEQVFAFGRAGPTFDSNHS